MAGAEQSVNHLVIFVGGQGARRRGGQRQARRPIEPSPQLGILGEPGRRRGPVARQHPEPRVAGEEPGSPQRAKARQVDDGVAHREVVHVEEQPCPVAPVSYTHLGKGRPRAVFHPTRHGARSGERNYQLMASVLADHLVRTSADPTGAAYEAGRSWGQRLAVTATGRPRRGTSLPAAVEMFQAMGLSLIHI